MNRLLHQSLFFLFFLGLVCVNLYDLVFMTLSTKVCDMPSTCAYLSSSSADCITEWTFSPKFPSATRVQHCRLTRKLTQPFCADTQKQWTFPSKAGWKKKKKRNNKTSKQVKESYFHIKKRMAQSNRACTVTMSKKKRTFSKSFTTLEKRKNGNNTGSGSVAPHADTGTTTSSKEQLQKEKEIQKVWILIQFL